MNFNSPQILPNIAGTACSYCKSIHLTVVHNYVYHKVDDTFGPFTLADCDECGALVTITPPTSARLSEFYSNYEDFRPDWYNSASDDGSLSVQYQFYAKLLAREAASEGTWLDVGGGHGEVANRLCSLLPKAVGTMADIGERPNSLSKDVSYLQADMNLNDWPEKFVTAYDLVFAVAVSEHVLNPAAFVANCLQLVADGGRLVIITPDYGSLASKITGTRWPYFEPGEHISIPTRKSMKLLMETLNTTESAKGRPVSFKVGRLNVGYSLRYLFTVLRLKFLARLFPPSAMFPMPTGILIVNATRQI